MKKCAATYKSDGVVYYPYKKQRWAIFFTIPMGLAAFVGAGFFFRCSMALTIYLIGIGLFCVWMTKVVYDSSKRFIVFEPEGVRIEGCSLSDHQYIPWEQLSHGYYVRNFKGHLFLVLSPDALNVKEAKHFARRAANLSLIHVDQTVVIYMDVLQDVTQIKKLFSNHGVRIDVH